MDTTTLFVILAIAAAAGGVTLVALYRLLHRLSGTELGREGPGGQLGC